MSFPGQYSRRAVPASPISSTGSHDDGTGLSALEIDDAVQTGSWVGVFNKFCPENKTDEVTTSTRPKTASSGGAGTVTRQWHNAFTLAHEARGINYAPSDASNASKKKTVTRPAPSNKSDEHTSSSTKTYTRETREADPKYQARVAEYSATIAERAAEFGYTKRAGATIAARAAELGYSDKVLPGHTRPPHPPNPNASNITVGSGWFTLNTNIDCCFNRTEQPWLSDALGDPSLDVAKAAAFEEPQGKAPREASFPATSINHKRSSTPAQFSGAGSHPHAAATSSVPPATSSAARKLPPTASDEVRAPTAAAGVKITSATVSSTIKSSRSTSVRTSSASKPTISSKDAAKATAPRISAKGVQGLSTPSLGVRDATEHNSSISLPDFRHLHALMDGSLDFKFLENGHMCFMKPRPPFHAFVKDCGSHENDDSVFSVSTAIDEKQILVTMAKIRDEVRTLFEHDTMLHTEATKLHSEISRLNAEVQRLKSTRKRADSGVASDSGGSSKNSRDLAQELGELRVRHDQECKKTSVLEQQIGELQVRHDRECHKASELEQQVVELKFRHDRECNKILELDEQLLKLKIRHEEECQKTSGLDHEIGNLKMRHDIERHTRLELEKQVLSIRKQTTIMQARYDDECEKTAMLEQELGELQIRHDHECNKSSALEKQLSSLRKQTATIQTRHEQVSSLKEENMAIQSLHDQECKKNSELHQQVITLREKNAAIQKLHEQECKKTSDLEKQISTLRTQQAEAMQTRHEQVNALQEHHAAIENLHKKECKKTSELEKQISTLQEHNAVLQNLHKKECKKTSELHQHVSTLQQQNTALQNMHKEESKKASELEKQVSILHKQESKKTTTLETTTTRSTNRVVSGSSSASSQQTAALESTTMRNTSRVASAGSAAPSYKTATRSSFRTTGGREADKMRTAIQRPGSTSRETEDYEDEPTMHPCTAADKNVAILFAQLTQETKEAADRVTELSRKQALNDPAVNKRRGDALARAIEEASKLYQTKRKQVYRLRDTYSGLEQYGLVSDQNDFEVTVDSLGGI